MAKKLQGLTIERVALVDRGANQQAHIVLAKRDTPEQRNHMDQDKAAQEKAALEKQLADSQAALAAKEKELAEMTGNSPLAKKDIVALRQKNAKLEAEVEKVRKELEGQLEQRTVELEETKAEVTKTRIERRREVFIKRAQELEHLPGAPAATFAEDLDDIEKALGAKRFARLNGLLDSWNTLIEKSAVFAELGREGGGETLLGAANQLDVMAKDLAASEKIEYSKAYARVLKANPKLYRKYRAEQTGGR